jgi:hypothetical protein
MILDEEISVRIIEYREMNDDEIVVLDKGAKDGIFEKQRLYSKNDCYFEIEIESVNDSISQGIVYGIDSKKNCFLKVGDSLYSEEFIHPFMIK